MHRVSHWRRPGGTVSAPLLVVALGLLLGLLVACGGPTPPTPDQDAYHLLISNYSDASIEVMASATDPATLVADTSLRLADPDFVSVIAVVWGPGDRLYVSDFALGQIRVYDADDALGAAAPTPLAIITSPDLQEPYAMAMDSGGALWVSDRRGSRDGSPVANAIVKLTGVAAASGTTSIAASVVVTLDSTAPAFASQWITSLTFDDEGDLWFTDVWDWAVSRISDPGSLGGTVTGLVPTLRLQSVNVGNPELSAIRNPQSVAIDGEGNLYVGNGGRDKVARFDAAASLTGDYVSGAKQADAMLAVGLFNVPLVALGPDGALWVASSGPSQLAQLVRVTGQADGSGDVALFPTRQFFWAPGNTNAYHEAGGMTFHSR